MKIATPASGVNALDRDKFKLVISFISSSKIVPEIDDKNHTTTQPWTWVITHRYSSEVFDRPNLKGKYVIMWIWVIDYIRKKTYETLLSFPRSCPKHFLQHIWKFQNHFLWRASSWPCRLHRHQQMCYIFRRELISDHLSSNSWLKQIF